MYARAIALTLFVASTLAVAETRVPTLSVTGHGLAQAAPNQATIVFAAVAQGKQAAEAQVQVNRVMLGTMEAIATLGIPADALATTGITLLPLYQDMPPAQPGEVVEPRIVGYQASNRLEVRLQDIAQVGPVIDSAVDSGINEIERVTLGLKDDRALRRAALANAAQDARLRAEAIAAAMGVRLLGVDEVTEEGMGLVRPLMERSMKAMAADAATPVQPGQVRVEATVTVRYRIGAEPAPGKGK
jgi:hypothetical protein